MVGVKSVTMEAFSGDSKAKSPGKSFSVFTVKLTYPPLLSVVRPIKSVATIFQ